jgi:hypothetical protein
VLREGFSPHEQRRAPAQAGFALTLSLSMLSRMLTALACAAGFALTSRGLQPDGTRRIPDVLLTLHQPAVSACGRGRPRTQDARGGNQAVHRSQR